MSGARNPDKQSGQMHRCSEAEPAQQGTPDDSPSHGATRSAMAARSAPKPDFDQSDRRPNSKRKASGPAQKRQRKPSPPSTPPSTPDVAPAEVTGVKGTSGTRGTKPVDDDA